MIEPALQKRGDMLDFTDIEDLKTCVMKVANSIAIRQSNKIKRCQAFPQGSSQLVCVKHCQTLDSPQLELLSSLMPPDLSKVRVSVTDLLLKVSNNVVIDGSDIEWETEEETETDVDSDGDTCIPRGAHHRAQQPQYGTTNRNCLF